MDIFTIIFWVIALLLLTISIIKDKTKTIKSAKKSRNMMKHTMPGILAIVLLIGIIVTYLPPDLIGKTFGESSSLWSTIISSLVGSVTLIPAFVAFPLVASFIALGASIVPGTAFLTTLTMVGFVTFPIEKKQFGMRFALVRNSLSFVFAIVIALFMGVILL